MKRLKYSASNAQLICDSFFGVMWRKRGQITPVSHYSTKWIIFKRIRELQGTARLWVRGVRGRRGDPRPFSLSEQDTLYPTVEFLDRSDAHVSWKKVALRSMANGFSLPAENSFVFVLKVYLFFCIKYYDLHNLFRYILNLTTFT